MISKATIKRIRSLEIRKYRKIEQLFVAEGPKLVEELTQLISPSHIYAVEEWIEKNPSLAHQTDVEVVTQNELEKISFLTTPQQVVALYPIPRPTLDISSLKEELILMLDGIQNPGNLGTIIRIADWFGIRHIICSHDTVDAFNPKVVQATMGALARVHIYYEDLGAILPSLSALMPIYGTLLDGENLYQQPLTMHGVIIMGNEGNGIQPDLRKYINNRLFIPNYPIGSATTESLNVAIATSIVCAEFRRRSIQS